MDADRNARFVSGDLHADVTAIVVTYNSASDVPTLIDDLRASARDLGIRVIVVDNESSDDTAAAVCVHDDVIFVPSGGNLGYAGGINVGMRHVGSCDALLILNPDLSLRPGAIVRLLSVLEDEGVGAVVPLILDADGVTYPSLRHEVSITRALGDALFGSKVTSRPSFSSEIDYRPASYTYSHDVDWATGAAILIPSTVAREVGEWDESYFLYSEETDFFRRIRLGGRRVRFEPAAVAQHRGSGSGSSPALLNLMAVNRIRYVERHRGRAYSMAFRAVIVISEALRSYNRVNRTNLLYALNRDTWCHLPQASKPPSNGPLTGDRQRGAVIVPAHNEAAVIARTLTPLGKAAEEGYFELIVVCNGCSDDTADIARNVAGVTVLELEKGSKPNALNAGDAAAVLWPRLYLDADIQIPVETVLAVLDRLADEDVMAVRPDFRYDSRHASPLVRSYYRARNRLPRDAPVVYGAGAYAMNAVGHQRVGKFPLVNGDDLYVDTRFESHEKAVVFSSPAIVRTPRDVRSLVAILRRGYRGTAEIMAVEDSSDKRIQFTGRRTARAVVSTIGGPFTAADAVVYLSIALAGRMPTRRGQRHWERDDSSRAPNDA